MTFANEFQRVQEAAHRNSVDKGFYQDFEILNNMKGLTADEYRAIHLRLVLARMAMIGSEVGEAVDAVRKNPVNTEAFAVRDESGYCTGTVQGSELADIVIRTMDLAEFMGIQLGEEIEGKMAYNRNRPKMHGKHA